MVIGALTFGDEELLEEGVEEGVEEGGRKLELLGELLADEE